MDLKLNMMYFSATGTTGKVVNGLAERLARTGNFGAIRSIDFTIPGIRREPASFGSGDLVIIGVPVYAGRVPNVLLKYLQAIEGNGALAVAITLYGNRDYDDALIELRDILAARSFTVIAAAAFIGEHSFSSTLAAGRPDEKDMQILAALAPRIIEKINSREPFGNVAVKGNRPYRSYYVPKREDGSAVYDFRKITPQTSEDCIDCKTCAQVCPVGSIDFDNVRELTGICIKCCACIKDCPVGAKYFDDPDYLHHKEELEIKYARRREPEIFI